MDKQVFIDKLALLSEELQILSSNWIRKDYQISSLEVDTYLSNLRYLSEQAQILRELLAQQQTEIKEEKTIQVQELPVEISPVEISDENPHVHMSSIDTRKPEVAEPKKPSFEQAAKDEFISELSLHEKLSGQMKESSIADSLKNSFFHKDLSFSLNERFFFINELFSGDQKDFDKVISHLATLDSWEEVEFYLNATCVVPYSWEEKTAQRDKFYELLQVRFN